MLADGRHLVGKGGVETNRRQRILQMWFPG